jgi:septal ring factor EnvC (AmiA/AmiB activator)
MADKATILTMYTISILEKISERQTTLIEQRDKDIKVHNEIVDKLNDDIANHRYNITYLEGAIKHLAELKEEISGMLSDKIKEINKEGYGE